MTSFKTHTFNTGEYYNVTLYSKCDPEKTWNNCGTLIMGKEEYEAFKTDTRYWEHTFVESQTKKLKKDAAR